MQHLPCFCWCSGSGWDGVIFPCSSPYNAVLCCEQHWYHTCVMSIAEQYLHSIKTLSKPPPPQSQQAGGLQDIDRVRTLPGWQNQPKRSSHIYQAIWCPHSAIEGGKGGRWMGHTRHSTLSLWRCLSSQTAAMYIEALLPGTCPNIACWWQVENIFVLSLCFYASFALFFPLPFSFN